MSTPQRLHRLLGSALCVLALSACTATAPPKPVGPPPLAETMSRAAAAESAGQIDTALNLWKEAALAYPSETEPWSEIAQTRFDAGQYGEAIMAAQEIEIRDPNHEKAKSIIAISGLRLSTRALADLSRANNLSGDTRAESQDLAKLLRESLGKDVLVPSTAAGSRAAKQPAARKSTAKPRANANPFDALQ